MNVSNATGTTVDAITLQKASTNLLLTTAGTTNSLAYGTLSFYGMLSDLPDYTDFTNLFDQYKIDSIEVIFHPYCTSSTTGAAYASAAGQTGVIVHTAVDYDDATLPTGSDAGIQLLREYQNYHCDNIYARHGGPLTSRFSPRMSLAAYQGAFTGYTSTAFGWVDCNSPNVQGYGFKAIFECVSGGFSTTVLFKAEARVHLSFRNVR